MVELTRKQKKYLKKQSLAVLKVLGQDINSWIYAMGRLMYNVFFMWLVFKFIYGFYLFVWASNELSVDQIQILHNMYYITGTIWLAYLMFTFKGRGN